ncbi:FilA [Acinetobacter guerrae]|uniref:FilA n=1 Tax=Acinetobacter guerrae TaxID=1843371 RepID=A0A3A8ENK0_9GAMM|nr:DUF6160 family protein [Acinetobacter guerrae]RKG36195.1 FilA [Acinetobacter guerrae]
MKKNKILGCISLICFAPLTFAMQPLDDQSLSATTGQDGINIGVGINKVQFNQVSLIDTNGYGAQATSYANRASLVVAGQNASPTTLTFNGANNTPSLNIVADTDGGINNKAFANLAVSFANQITGLTISPFSIYLAGTNSTSAPNSSKSIFTGTNLNSDVKELLRVGSNIDVNFVSGNAPKMNIQLGNAPQGHMIQFGGAISSICSGGCPITLVSQYVDAQTPANSYSTGVTFDLGLKATDTVNGFSLNNFYAGVESGGFVFGNTGTSSKLDASLGNVTMGTVGKTDSNVFNGIQNGPIGNIGAVGASVTDLKVKISGM